MVSKNFATLPGQIGVGDAIRDAAIGVLRVASTNVDNAAQRVHNLEITGAATYFVGDLEAWGHNAKWSKHRKTKYGECKGKCSYCGVQTVFKGPRKGPRKDRFSVDHIVPRKWGGTDEASNLIGCCVSCNSKRGAPKP